eukprot:5865727-Prorocentrum_lima.AAC.1
MTSSLVGSEMCIRDRGSSISQPGEPSGASAAGPGRSFQPGKRKHVEPVSYTHLTLPTICSV